MKSSRLKTNNQRIPENVLIVAGEVSGDQLAASIFQKIQDSKQYHFFGCGGDELKKLNVEILFHVKQLEVIGYSEAVFKYISLKSYLKYLVRESVRRKVKYAFLVDYSGFNLILARKLKKHNIQSHLIVSPQIWAWRPERIHTIRENIVSVFCLYDFEVEIYKKNRVPAFLIGHPIADKVFEYKKIQPKSASDVRTQKKCTISLLPGSRKKEIDRLLPFMIQLSQVMAKKLNNLNFLLPCPRDKRLTSRIKSYLGNSKANIKLIPGKIYDALSVSQVAIVCSGTASLECVFFGVPLLLLYKTSWFTYLIGRSIAITPYLGMANIIASRRIHKEFIQGDIKIDTVSQEAMKLISDHYYRKKMIDNLKRIENKITKKNAPLEASRIIKKILKNRLKLL